MAWKSALPRWGIPALLLGLWALASSRGPWPAHLLPGPAAVARSFARMAQDGSLLEGAARSMSRLLQGYVLSVAVGLPLGFMMARLEWVRAGVKPVVMGLQSLPSICWLPLALLWFGLSDAAILFVVVMGSVLGIAIAAEDAVRTIDPQLLRVSGTLGVKTARMYTGVILPAALPGIVTGLKLGWSFAWRALMAGELLYVSGGLGQLLTTGRELMNVDQVLAVMVAIILIGTAVDRVLFQTVETRIRHRWGLLAT